MTSIGNLLIAIDHAQWPRAQCRSCSKKAHAADRQCRQPVVRISSFRMSLRVWLSCAQPAAPGPSKPPYSRGVRMHWRALAVLALAALPKLALAQEVNLVDLRWDSPVGCPGVEVVERRVRELAGSLERESRLSAVGRVVVDNGSFELHLETYDAGRKFVRDVKLTTCDQAAETAALILAMALRAELSTPAADPENGEAQSMSRVTTEPSLQHAPDVALQTQVLAAELPSGPAPIASSNNTASAPLPPAANREPELSSPETPTATARSQFAASLTAAVNWGIAPEALWSLDAAVAWLPAPWRVEVVGGFAPAQRFALKLDPMRGGEFVWWNVGVRGCYAFLQGSSVAAPLAVSSCVGGEAGELRGVGFGTTLRQEGISPWASLYGGASGTWALFERLRLLARAELAAPLSRDSFVLRNTDEQNNNLVARPAGVVGRLKVGVEGLF